MERLVGQCAPMIEEIEQAFRQGAGKWIGCDWPTEFGKTGLNLNGLKSSQALLLARATSGDERADWRLAVDWLSRVEADARVAEEMAKQAIGLAREQKLVGAIFHAESACEIEGRYHTRLVWRPLRDAIDSASNALD